MKDDDFAPLFELFWENSKLNDKNSMNFFDSFKNEEINIEPIKYSTNDVKLRLPKDKLFKTMCKRHSARKYKDYELTEKELSSLFSSFASVDNHRLLPSAGGKYPIEVYALCFNVKDLTGKIVYYNYKENSLSIIGECKNWNAYENISGSHGYIDGSPSIMFIFVAFKNRATSKYGERGGRFLLIESGHYLQNLSLRIAYENLSAVELGGLYDENFKELLKLKNEEALITLGLICGKENKPTK